MFYSLQIQLNEVIVLDVEGEQSVEPSGHGWHVITDLIVAKIKDLECLNPMNILRNMSGYIQVRVVLMKF